MKVEVRLLLDVSDDVYRSLEARVRLLPEPCEIQLHSRDMPAAHLGDGILVGIAAERASS